MRHRVTTRGAWNTGAGPPGLKDYLIRLTTPLRTWLLNTGPSGLGRIKISKAIPPIKSLCQNLGLAAPKARNVKAWGNAPGEGGYDPKALKARNALV
ncbi:MAG: hypothetical protein ACRD9S_15035 [Pyrinomonadaceae bacterium]